VGAGRAAVALAAILVVVAAGCGDRGGAQLDPTGIRVTPQVPTASPVDASVAARAAVLEAYRGMWAAFDQAGRGPRADPDDPRLARYATGDALRVLVGGLASMREDGVVIDGEVVLAPEVVDLSPAHEPTRARVEDCGDSTNWLTVSLDTGRVSDGPRGRQLVIANLHHTADGWKVVDFAVRGVGSCDR
jgi:hypothetical protein